MANRKDREASGKSASKPVSVNGALSVAPSKVEAPVAPAAQKVMPAPESVPSIAAATAVAAPFKIDGRRDRSTIVQLIGALRNPEADIARDAAVRLGTLLVDLEAVDALCAVIRNRDGFYHSVVRAAAAATLGKLGDRRAVDALIEATRDPMAEASEEAVKALGLLGDPRALPTLQGILRNADGFFLENVRKSADEASRRIAAKKL